MTPETPPMPRSDAGRWFPGTPGAVGSQRRRPGQTENMRVTASDLRGVILENSVSDGVRPPVVWMLQTALG